MVKSVEVNVSKYEVPKAAHIPQKTNYKTKNAANDNQHYSDEGGSDEGKGDHHGMKCCFCFIHFDMLKNSLSLIKSLASKVFKSCLQ